MEASLLLMEQIFVMFLLGVVGFLVVKIGLLETKDSKILSKVCVYITMPCVIIDSFYVERSPEVFSGFLLALGVSVVCHIIYIVFCRLGRKVLHLTAVERASIIYANVGNLVIPLTAAVFGTDWLIYVCAFVIVQTILMWTHGVVLICHDGNNIAWKKIFSNINMIAICIGIFLFITQLPLPLLATDIMDRFGCMMGPLAMLIMGMLIADVDLKEVFKNKRVYLICFLRLIVCPLLSLLLVLVSGIGSVHPQSHMIIEAVLLSGSSASATTITQISQVYGEDSKYANIINVMTIMFCVITMPLNILIFELLVHF